MARLAFHHTRHGYFPFGTYGRVQVWSNEDPSLMLARWFTVEQPWNANLRGESCIPEGVYECSRAHFNRGGYDTVQLVGVPRRSQIKVHVANWPEDVEGCIGIGQTLIAQRTRYGVGKSREAMKQLLQILDDNDGLSMVWSILSHEYEHRI
jgi:hypothetical protein